MGTILWSKRADVKSVVVKTLAPLSRVSEAYFLPCFQAWLKNGLWLCPSSLKLFLKWNAETPQNVTGFWVLVPSHSSRPVVNCPCQPVPRAQHLILFLVFFLWLHLCDFLIPPFFTMSVTLTFMLTLLLDGLLSGILGKYLATLMVTLYYELGWETLSKNFWASNIYLDSCLGDGNPKMDQICSLLKNSEISGEQRQINKN